MKKRLRGLMALCIIACMAFAGTTGIASAAEQHKMDDLNNNQLLYPGDTVINGNGSGGSFVVVDSSGTVISAGTGAVYIYDEGGTNQYNKLVDELKCYGWNESYSIPNLPIGYSYNAVIGDWINQEGPKNFNGYYDGNIYPIETLYLQRVLINYSINYDANGGSGSVDNTTFTVEALGNLSDGKAITKNGVAVKSWNTKKDGSGTAYAPGAAVNTAIISGAVDNTITLYAQWSDGQSDKSPATGDSANLALLGLMMLGAAGACVVALRRKKA